MTFYLLTLLFFFLCSLVEINTKGNPRFNSLNWFLIAVGYLLLVFQIGFRWETGTDWMAYLNWFDDFNFDTPPPKDPQMEYGYYFISLVFNKISHNYSAFLVSISVFYLLLLFIFFKKISFYFFPAILLYYALFLGLLGSNRQWLAISICFVGLTFLINGNKKYFLISVFCAYFFHSSALLFLMYYFFDRRFNLKFILLSIIISIIIGLTPLPLKVFSLFGGISEQATFKADAYLRTAKEELVKAQVSTIGLIKRLLISAAFIILRIKYPSLGSDKRFNLVFNGYICGIIFYFIFSKTLLVMISRGGIYFNMMEPLLMSSVFFVPALRKYRNFIIFIFFFASIFYIYQSIASYPSLFDPYKSLFINRFYYRKMF